MTYAEGARKLRHLGCQKIRRRSGGAPRKWMNPTTGRVTVLPDWGAKDFHLARFERSYASSVLTGTPLERLVGSVFDDDSSLR
jgi:hypothetical protein